MSGKGARGQGYPSGGVPGVPAANMLVIGGGVVGTNAARMAMGMGAQVTLADRSVKRLQEIDTFMATGCRPSIQAGPISKACFREPMP